MVIIWIILGALLLWEIQSVWYAKHWDEELFVSLAFSRKSTVRGESCELLETFAVACSESKISGVEAIGI